MEQDENAKTLLFTITAKAGYGQPSGRTAYVSISLETDKFLEFPNTSKKQQLNLLEQVKTSLYFRLNPQNE